jgi:hypothetical protein
MIAKAPLDVGALHTLAAAMDQPDVAEARAPRGVQVFINDRPHVLRCKRMQIDGVFDRDSDGFFVHDR